MKNTINLLPIESVSQHPLTFAHNACLFTYFSDIPHLTLVSRCVPLPPSDTQPDGRLLSKAALGRGTACFLSPASSLRAPSVCEDLCLCPATQTNTWCQPSIPVIVTSIKHLSPLQIYEWDDPSDYLNCDLEWANKAKNRVLSKQVLWLQFTPIMT